MPKVLEVLLSKGNGDRRPAVSWLVGASRMRLSGPFTTPEPDPARLSKAVRREQLSAAAEAFGGRPGPHFLEGPRWGGGLAAPVQLPTAELVRNNTITSNTHRRLLVRPPRQRRQVDVGAVGDAAGATAASA